MTFNDQMLNRLSKMIGSQIGHSVAASILADIMNKNGSNQYVQVSLTNCIDDLDHHIEHYFKQNPQFDFINYHHAQNVKQTCSNFLTEYLSVWNDHFLPEPNE